MNHRLAVPKRIHFCWYGHAPLSSLSERCIQTWRDVMPDYEVRRWDDGALDRTSPYVKAAYRQKQYAFVADYMRLRILHDEGGIYLDTDIEAVRPLDDLRDTPLFFGLQSPGSIGVSVIGAEKGHPFLLRLIQHLDQEAENGKPSFQPLPELVTAMARERDSDVPTIFPEDYFYPYNPYSPVALRKKPLYCNVSETTFCIHHWEGTWLGDMSLRMMLGLRIKKALRRVSIPLSKKVI